MLRLLHIGVVVALVFAAADVYKIKFESTLQVERAAKLRSEIRKERDAVAALRAEWTELDRPERIEQLARQHSSLRPIDTSQFDQLDRLPDRPVEIVPSIGALAGEAGPGTDERPTGSASQRRDRR
jgi:cell division protein FtsL